MAQARTRMTRSWMALAGALSLGWGGFLAAQWQYGPPLNTPRAMVGVAVDGDGLIYAIAGSSVSGPWDRLASVERLNESTGAWEYVASLNVARTRCSAVTDLQGRVYATGGGNVNKQPISLVERYDSARNVWEFVAPMNIARASHATATDLSGRIYAMGGGPSDGVYLSTVERYDPALDRWEYIASMNRKRVGFAAAADALGRIYAIGGTTYGGILSTVERYDPAHPELGWQYVASMPSSRGDIDEAAVTTPDGRIWVLGGWPALNTVLIYDPGANAWTSGPPLLQARDTPGAAWSPSGKIYAIGGHAGLRPLTSVETLAVSIPDTTPPAIVCPPDTSVLSGANSRAEVPDLASLATVSDDRDPAPSVTQDPPAGTIVGLGDHVVTITATDAAGNASSCQSTLTVLDSQPPVVSITSPASGSILAAASVTIVAEVTDETTTDVSSTPPGLSGQLVNPTYLPLQETFSGSVALAEGPSTIVVSGVDSNGNVGSDSIDVVVDTVAPAITVSPAEGAVLADTPAALTVRVTDATATTVEFGTNVRSAPAGSVDLPLEGSVDLVERSGNAIAVTAADAAGNRTVVVRSLTLDLTAPLVTIDAPASGAFFGPGSSPVAVTATVDDLTATTVASSVNGAPAALSGSLPAGGGIVAGAVALTEGLNEIAVSATDETGRVGTASVPVTLDTTPPSIAVASPLDGAVFRESPVPFEIDVIDATSTAVTAGASSGSLPAGGGHLSLLVDLSSGESLVPVIATDRVGNTSVVEVRVVINAPPVVEVICEQLTATGTEARVRLDGSGTSDPDHALSELSLEWIVDGAVLAGVTSPVVEVPLSFGTHAVTLRATDPLGATGEATKTIEVDPARLLSLDIEKAEVEWGHAPAEAARIEIKGEIGLPFGVGFTEIDPVARLSVNVAGLLPRVLPETAVSFTVHGHEGEKWRYRGEEGVGNGLGLRKLDIDWRGSRYRFEEHGFPLKLKSEVITSEETVLELELESKKLDTGVSIDFGQGAVVDIDATGAAAAGGGVLLKVEKPGRELELTLPFAIDATTVIQISGGVSATLLVADRLQPSVGRFRLEARFDGSLLPQGPATLPRTLDLTVAVGSQRYPGDATLGPDELQVKEHEWKARKGEKKHHD